MRLVLFFFFFQAEDGIRDLTVTGVQTCALPICFGLITGIDVRGEARGVLPSTEWKRNTYKRPEQKKWYAGETISLGIGQGYNNFTILQLANAMSTLAAKGVKHRPHLAVGRVDAVTQQFSAINK